MYKEVREMNKKLFCIIGKSATGKDTIYTGLLYLSKTILDHSYQLYPLVTCTTRPIRPGETDGKEYHFVTVDELNRLMELGKVIEHRVYHTVHGIGIISLRMMLLILSIKTILQLQR